MSDTVEVYLMGAAMSGTTGVGQATAEIDLSASKVFSNLQFAGLVNYRHETPAWAATADVVYLALGASREGEHGLLTTRVDADQWIVQAHGSWRLSAVFEVLAGVRFTSMTDTVVLTPYAGTVRRGDLTKSWLDPIVGARVKAPVGAGFSLEGYGDVGGFGIGSDFTWMLTARVNYEVSRKVGLGVGYRALYQDYSTGSGGDAFLWKITAQGPLAAVNLSF